MACVPDNVSHRTLRNPSPKHRVQAVVRRIILTILTLAVLLPSAAFAGARYLCAMDGQVRSDCCCPTKAKQQRDAEPTTQMRSNCCCTISTTAPTVTPPQIKEETASLAIPVIPIAVPVPAFALPAQERVIISQAADSRPPKPDRTLFVRYCALLL